MFDKISGKRLKSILVFKYIVQLLGVPFVMGVSVLIIIVIAEIFISGFYNAIKVFFVEKVHLFGNLYIPLWLFVVLSIGAVTIPTNILSVLPFCKLVLDCHF